MIRQLLCTRKQKLCLQYLFQLCLHIVKKVLEQVLQGRLQNHLVQKDQFFSIYQIGIQVRLLEIREVQH